MDSFACDLLVHIAAPSSIQDDKRYEAIARSVLDFQPATVAQLAVRDRPSQSPPATEVLDHTDSQEAWPYIEGASSTWIQAHDDAFKQHQNLYRSPSGLFVGKAQSSTASNEGRPKTAPAGASSPSGLNALCTGASRRRAHSEISSVNNSFSTVPDSLGVSRYANIPAASAEFPPNTSDGSDEALSYTETLELSHGPERKKRRTDGHIYDDNLVNRIENFQHDPVSTFLCLQTPETLRSQARIDSVSSTLSPSQPLKLGRSESPTSCENGNLAIAPPPIAIIDLTTPGRREKVLHPVPTMSRVHVSEAKVDVSRQSSGSRIGRLVDEVNGPEPPGGKQRFTTHITKTLAMLSERVSLTKVFQPTRVERDVRALERGHWVFSIKVRRVDEVMRLAQSTRQDDVLGKVQDVHEHRVPPRDMDQVDDEGAGQDQALYFTRNDGSIWTEDEFVAFWESLSQFIREGKAGWGSRLVKEAEPDGSWKVTMFCWGEVVGHIWLTLWVLSDKLTGRLPMTWVAGDGTIVIRMSGRKKEARLGR